MVPKMIRSVLLGAQYHRQSLAPSLAVSWAVSVALPSSPLSYSSGSAAVIEKSSRIFWTLKTTAAMSDVLWKIKLWSPFPSPPSPRRTSHQQAPPPFHILPLPSPRLHLGSLTKLPNLPMSTSLFCPHLTIKHTQPAQAIPPKNNNQIFSQVMPVKTKYDLGVSATVVPYDFCSVCDAVLFISTIRLSTMGIAQSFAFAPHTSWDIHPVSCPGRLLL